MKSNVTILLSCLIIFCTTGFLQAQEVQSVSQTMSAMGINNQPSFDGRYEGVRGTPYISKEWQPGLMFHSGGTPVRMPALNFDRHALELCCRENDDAPIRLMNKYMIDSFYIFDNPDTLLFERVRLPGTSNLLYLERLLGTGSALYLDRAKLFVKADYEQVYSADRRYDEYKDKQVFYIRLKKDGELLEVKKNRKQLAALFGAQQSAMMAYLKSEKTNSGKAEDLVLMLKYYDKLVE